MSLQIKNLTDYHTAYQKSISDPDAFWSEIADSFTWKKKWNKVYDWAYEDSPMKWFEGATLNITENCLDRHLADKGDQLALIWEPNDPGDSTRSFTYLELYQEVCRTAHMLC
ncbi:MAG: acetyl-coenzyme A synthetase N-terminal domain-containing protein, partial [Saprospiraceae bacterium]